MVKGESAQCLLDFGMGPVYGGGAVQHALMMSLDGLKVICNL